MCAWVKEREREKERERDGPVNKKSKQWIFDYADSHMSLFHKK